MAKFAETWRAWLALKRNRSDGSSKAAPGRGVSARETVGLERAGPFQARRFAWAVVLRRARALDANALLR